MKLKTVKMMGVLTIALLLAGCGEGAKETPKPADSSIQTEENAPKQVQPAASNAASVSEPEVSAGNNLISENEAKGIALKDAGFTEDQISGIRIQLEKDDRTWQYEVEFYAEDKEYDYEIDAASGNILSKDMDIEDDFNKSGDFDAAISEEQAKKTALDKVPGAGDRDIKIHLDEDDGKAVYEGSIIYEEREYEFEIDANSGKILDWEEESVYD